MKIGIIGLGYVGLPLALHFAEAGADVLGFDIDANKVALINSGRSPIRDIEAKRVADALSKLVATSDPSQLTTVNAIIICVPTPLTAQREPDMSFILATLELIGPYLKAKGAIISYSDPHLSHFPKMREHHLDLSSEEVTAELLESVDCVVVATDHDGFDYDLNGKHASLIVDIRGRYREAAEKRQPRLDGQSVISSARSLCIHNLTQIGQLYFSAS